MLQLHGYQRRAIDMILKKKQVFLMADMGLGKTAMVLKALERTDRTAIVFAPLAGVYNTWPEEIRKWTPNFSLTILHGPKKNERLKRRTRIYLINYEGLKWFFQACSNGKFPLKKYFMVWDESSFIKNPSTQRFKLFKKMFGIFSEYRLLLSATPMPNGLHELWPQVFLLDQGKRLSVSFYKFRNKYFHYSGPPLYRMWPRDHAEENITNAIQDTCFRLDANDYLAMPSLVYNTIDIPLGAQLQKKYDRLEKDFFIELDGVDINAINSAAMTMKLRQFVQGFLYDEDKTGKELHQKRTARLKAMVEGAAGNPILAAVQFKYEVDMIRRDVDKNVPLIVGGTPAPQKRAYIQDWNRGHIPLMIAHPLSMSHSVNLQAGGHTVVWYANTFSQEQYSQFNGRVFRQGQQHGVVINHFRCPGTVDDIMLKTVHSKYTGQKAFLDAVNEYRKEKGI